MDLLSREPIFADVSNLEHCIKYLNQTLTTYGFPSSLDLFSGDRASVVRICNCIYAILQQLQRDSEFREANNEQRQRLLSDMSRLEAKVERLDAQLVAKERELATLTSKEQKASSAFKAQLEKLQQERDELQRMLIGSQQVRTQQSHELKKKEKEYLKLQERLNQVLVEKRKESKSGMEIMNLLQKEGRQRGTWNGKKADGDFYKMIVDAYETKQQELMSENTDLRALLRSMQSDMRDFLNAPNGALKPESEIAVGLTTERASSMTGEHGDLFDLPFHMAREQIEQNLRAKMTSIKERMLQLQEAQLGAEVTFEASERELELEAQLLEARSIIQEQASLMGKHVSSKDESRNCISGHLDAEKEAVLNAAEDRVYSQEHAKQLETERSALRKMAFDFDKERHEIGKAKCRLEASWETAVKLWAPEISAGKSLK
ncbi:hypothetical protein O6H91_07G117700 [Diphasiastrum complanatum]|uniref:Uncharacterized protein n=1 Tax=Diphasiastrum complanatum TaxID=34168 RepID=A0ACC2D9I4_DIPCM|nr:hypothetical protein O6H91_07G117700 [Diphasiastrum complanatum]